MEHNLEKIELSPITLPDRRRKERVIERPKRETVRIPEKRDVPEEWKIDRPKVDPTPKGIRLKLFKIFFV